MKARLLIFLVSVLFLYNVAKADEGMWIPAFLSELKIEKMHKMGFELTLDDIYSINNSSIKDAVVALDRGSCTGEIVSDEGLFLTNHHCGYGEIQKHSSEENNILKNGFWAKNKSEELPNPGKSVSILIRIEDVTDSIMRSLNIDMDEDVRQDTIKNVSFRIEQRAIEGTHYEAVVKDFYESNRFYLIVTETFNDVRLVAAPPHFLGKFGGDTDNWMWPRHTADFAIFRIYTSPDGKPASYSSDNIPLKPRHFFPISLKGYEDNDFAMVMGFPGSTNRYLTAQGVEHVMNVVNNTRIDVREKKLDVMKQYMKTSDKATIQYATKYARSSNYYKYSIGQNKGLQKLNVVQVKKEQENMFQNWVNESDDRQLKYADALSLISEGYNNQIDEIAYNFLIEALLRGPEIFFSANKASQLRILISKNAPKNEIDLAIDELRKQAELFFKDYHPKTDEAITSVLTQIFTDKVDRNYHPDFVKQISIKNKGNFDNWAKQMFKKSIFSDSTKFYAFLSNPKKGVIESDLAYQASEQIYNMIRKIQKETKLKRNTLAKGYRLYLEGLLEMGDEKLLYPNANSTLRMTYGSVGGYSPQDAVYYKHYTTIKGYLEKEIPGDREFDVWPKLKELYTESDFGRYADKNGTINTCFITNNDITGGNSGSPVLNARGELIGIAFDGNWEAMSGDVAFEHDLQKCINVDIRFVLWTIDKFAGATHLLEEMKILD
jgi:hypothetical protein